tara:strand:- start:116 stop:286 length:171 start_codon:yes stop_codon:yes gene_type:complete
MINKDKQNFISSIVEETNKQLTITRVFSSLPCERINRLDNNRCVNCGVKAGSECAR